ncbi:MAG: hypothetical protein LBS57_08170 [Treponema sp.]|jgi:hypothetical protein|nr:hypothetical protein [Treponema sp.]
MKKISIKFRKPQTIFIMYMLVSFLLIMGFRFIFPGEAAPLPCFSRNWRLVRGALDVLTLFPALALSALVVPFGLVPEYEELYTSFSPKFFQRLVAPIVTSICAAAIYGLIFFLVLPMFHDMEENMRHKGELYRQAKEQAQLHRAEGEWLETAQFVGICESVWPESPELASLKTEAAIQLAERRFEEEAEDAAARARLASGNIKLPGDEPGAALSGLPGARQPVDAAEALVMGEAALRNERYWDAHWLATLGGRIARQGSPEAAEAARLSGMAWNKIESLEPNRREERLYSLFNLKQSGYQAMVSDDWIRAFYIFQELIEQSPDDPDVAKFLTVSEKGTKELAFFIDEMEVSLGDALTGAVFSLPARYTPPDPQGEVSLRQRNGAPGRTALRIASLSAFPDYAYGLDLEFLSFDNEARPLARLDAPYVKLMPVTLDGRAQVKVLMRALDRHDKDRRWEGEWQLEAGIPNIYRSGLGDTQIILDISYEHFLLLSRIRRGLASLQLGELFSASRLLGQAGYISQVFQAEILNRLGAALFFLPMTILSIIIGWCFRVKRRPRYLFIPMLPVLPLVFTGLTSLYRTALNTLGITLIISIGFSAAFAVFIAAMAASFILSLIFLAAQHG